MKKRWSSAGLLILAFAAGFLLYQAAVSVGGILAAIAIPREFFAWFGRPRLELALAILNLATFTFPIAALFSAGTLATYKLLRAPPLKSFMLAIVAGAVTCFAFYTASFVLVVQELPPGVESYPASVLLKQLLLPPWWSVPNAVAPWLGLAFAGWLIVRQSRH
jgi:hypothetical protein